MLSFLFNKENELDLGERLKAYLLLFFSTLSVVVPLVINNAFVIPGLIAASVFWFSIELCFWKRSYTVASSLGVIQAWLVFVFAPLATPEVQNISILIFSLFFYNVTVLGVSNKSWQVYSGLLISLATVLFTRLSTNVELVYLSLGFNLVALGLFYLFKRYSYLKKKSMLRYVKYANDLEDLLKEKDEELKRASTEKNQFERLLALQRTKNTQIRTEHENVLKSLAHELKNPIHILKHVFEHSDIGLNKNIGEESLESINRFVNDLMDSSQINSGSLKIEKKVFNVIDLLDNLKTIFENKGKEKGLYFNYNYDHAIPQFVKGDRVRLEQVLSNVLGNAVKFTEQGEISFFTDLVQLNLKHTELRFSIIDTGAGIPHSKRKEIFERFNRIGEEQVEGFGLGLYLVKDILSALGGRVDVLDNPNGRGTRFDVYIEFELYNSVENKKRVESTEFPLRGLRVLYAEDNVFNRLVMEQQLRPLEIEITGAENGLHALDLAKSKRFDVILMDLQMPKMDGFLAAQNIREKSLNKDTPIIALTGNSSSDIYEELKNAKIQGLVHKPFSKEDLKLEVKKVLQQSQSLSSHQEPIIPLDR